MRIHDQMGLDMRKMAEEGAQREDVKAFARRTIEEQTNDIEELRHIQQSMTTGTAGHDDRGSMMKRQSDKVMADLRQAQSAAFDQKVIEMMIPHHQQASDMSKPPTKFEAQDVQAFARKTVDSQGRDIQELKQPQGTADRTSRRATRRWKVSDRRPLSRVG